MRKALILVVLLFVLAQPVCAMEFTAPSAPETVQDIMPQSTQSFGEGLWYVVKQALGFVQPSIVQACATALSLIAVVLLCALVKTLTGESNPIVELVGAVTIGILLLSPSNALIRLGTQTVDELSGYGKLLLPVMTGAMAAQGGVGTSAALYAGTAFFDAVLSTAISKLLTPMIYLYLCMAVANSAIGEQMLKRLRDFIKWLMTWGLKIILYLFTGYMGITGVVSGSVDAAAVKATKLTISGMVPVVGGILSDASEAVLVGAGVMKSAAGVYGLLAVIAIGIGPFLRIGIQYLILKLSAAVCGVFGTKRCSELIADFSGAMGLLLAMTGAVCLMLLVSTVCFMRSVV